MPWTAYFSFSFWINVYAFLLIAESSIVADQPVLGETTSVEVENSNTGNQVGELEDNQKQSISDKDGVAEETVQAEQIGHAGNVLAENSVVSNQNVARSITEAAVSNLQEDAPKKSFASVVRYCPSFTETRKIDNVPAI